MCAGDGQVPQRKARLSVAAKSRLHSSRVNERYRLWLLKNSFRGFSARNFVCKLLNVGWPETLKRTKITALVPFSTATPGFVNYPLCH